METFVTKLKDLAYRPALAECYSICVEYAKPDFSTYEREATVESSAGYPYIPYVPRGWNGVLVLGLAQNHAGIDDETKETYGDCLRKCEEKNPEASILRLYEGESPQLGPVKSIKPWEDGFLPLALECAVPGCHEDEIARSNAVLWSFTQLGGRRDFPPKWGGPQLERSVVVWTEMLKRLGADLKLLITYGVVAHSVMGAALNEARVTCPHVRWTHPSHSYPRLTRDKTKYAELLQYEPEAMRVIMQGRFSSWKTSKSRLLYACHAVKETRSHEEYGQIQRLCQ
jgi:hypothetical protein